MNKIYHIKQVFFKQDFHKWTKENHVFYIKKLQPILRLSVLFQPGYKVGQSELIVLQCVITIVR